MSKFKRTYEELRYSEIGAGNTEDALMVEDMCIMSIKMMRTIRYLSSIRLSGGAA